MRFLLIMQKKLHNGLKIIKLSQAMKRKVTVVIITLIIILIGGYYYEQANTRSQHKGLYQKGPLSNPNIETANFVAANEGPTVNEIELKSQLEELNEQLIDARAELKLAQDKLILSTSKNTILENDLQDSRDTLETLQKVLERIAESMPK